MPSALLSSPGIPLWLARYTPDPSLPQGMNSCQFFVSPDAIKRVTEVDWVSIIVPGLSHEVLQYQHTKNSTLAGLELMVSREAYRRGAKFNPGDDVVEAHGRFLEQFCYSDPDNQSQRLDAPDRMVLLLPAPGNPQNALIFLVCVLTKFEVEYTQYDMNGVLIHAKYVIDLQEIRDARLASSSVARQGAVRPEGASRPDGTAPSAPEEFSDSGLVTQGA